MKLYSPATIAALREKHGFKISKSLGQNFLTDQNIIDKIIDGAEIETSDVVLEIGPGMGVLTAAAAERASKVIAIEIDKNLLPVLADTLAEHNNIEVIHGDVLKQDLNEIIAQSLATDSDSELEKSAVDFNAEPTANHDDPLPKSAVDADANFDESAIASTGSLKSKVKIIGNLPYYITTPIIMKILEEKICAKSITIMMQKEVAERINAKPGNKTYGAITVAINYYCTVHHITDVHRSVFIPKPNVDSQVIRLDIRETPSVFVESEKVFFACIKAGFGQRRKTLSNALTGVCGLEKQEVLEALASAKIDPTRRAETLDLSEFAILSNYIAAYLSH